MKKFFKHFLLVCKHRHQVIKNGMHMGFFFCMLTHDLSKFSIKELLSSYRYYKGSESPIYGQRKDNGGYSDIAIHHTRKNKHHYEYWVDIFKGHIILRAMPFRYAVEYVCDMMSASKTYDPKNFSGKAVYDYFMKGESRYYLHPATKEFVKSCFLSYEESGFKNLKKKILKAKYEEIIKKYPKTVLVNLTWTDDNAEEVIYGKK